MRLAAAVFPLLSTLVASRSGRSTGSGLATSVPLGSGGPAYRDQLVSLHQSLVEIPSVTGSENAVGDFLVEYLAERNFTIERQFLPSDGDAKPHYNVLAWPGLHRSASPKVLVTSHIDVVPPHIPYSRSDGVPNADTIIAGRGSVDAKASVAAQITAVLELLDAQRIGPDDVMLLFVVNEETDGAGMKHFSAVASSLDPPLRFRAAVFGEPTEGKLACGHKGLFTCTVTARGKAGHSGYPELGRSATEVLMRGLVKLLDSDVGSSEKFGNTTINIGTIEGGVASNVIPELAVAAMAGRVAIGPEDGGGEIVVERVKDILRSVDEEAFEFSCMGGYGIIECECDVEGNLSSPPFSVSYTCIPSYSNTWPGFDTITVNYGTDVHNLKGDHARYLYGPGNILVAHGADEALRLGDLETAVEDFGKIILHALRDETGEL
ncbi:Zn-dependent exopeptidase [Xylaria intraflava]|nr:Zn-dependent exopeptidase [Xylaria intraflava]